MFTRYALTPITSKQTNKGIQTFKNPFFQPLLPGNIIALKNSDGNKRPAWQYSVKLQ